MSQPRRFAPLVLVLATILALVPPTSQATTGGELLVGFDGAVDPALISSLGGTTLRTFPDIRVAHVWADNAAAFTAAATKALGVSFVETSDPLRLDVSSWDGQSVDVSSWDATSTDASRWDASTWDASRWDASRWDASTWDASRWDVSSWDASRWDASTWDASRWDVSSWDWGTMDPGYPHQWGLGAANFPDAWSLTTGSGRTHVCVLDTGVDATHPDLRPSLWRSPNGTYGQNAMLHGTDPRDDVGHGTHVAGILGAVSANGTGITGAARVSVVSVKVMDKSGGDEADLAQGLLLCARSGARVASMSLHIDAPSATVERAIRHVQEQRGMLVIASAGNAGNATVSHPAAYPGVLAVGAVRPDATLAGFSNHGPRLDLVAPGERIVSTLPGDAYAIGSGTSQAAPFVAAAAALAFDLRPDWTAANVSAALTATARDLGAPGKDATFGHGALDAGAALRRVAGQA